MVMELLYYGAGAVIGGLGYYIYKAKKGAATREVPNRGPWPLTQWNPPNQPSLSLVPPGPQTNKFEMD